MKKPTLIVAVSVGAALVWHMLLGLTANREYCVDSAPAGDCKFPVTVEINPLNDIATVKMPGAADFGITDRTEAAGFKWGRDITGVPEAERQLNLYARRYLDLYAILIPYRVSIVDRKSAENGSSSLPSAVPPADRESGTHLPGSTSSSWANVTVLGFTAGESPEAAAGHAVDLKMTRLGTCAYRKDGNVTSPAYVDCQFLGSNDESMEISFYSGELQRIEYKFPAAHYDDVLAKIVGSFGNPRTLTNPYEPSEVVSLDWGGPHDKFDISLGRTADGAQGWVSVTFDPPN